MAPLALDPEERFPLVLRTDLAARGFDPDDPASDEKAAAAGAPHFLCRYMTCREWREYRQAGELDRDSTPPAQVQNDLFYALHLAIVGWQGLTDRDGQPLPSDPARL